VDLLFGYEVFPHILPFVEAGVSFVDQRSHFQLEGFGQNVASDNNTTPSNYTQQINIGGYKTTYDVGVGSYFLLQKNWFIFTELVYDGVTKTSGSSATTIVPGTISPLVSKGLSVNSNNSQLSLFAGVSYLFPV
jgi:hypothetical protein